MNGEQSSGGRGGGIGCAVAGFFAAAWFGWGMAEPVPTAVGWLMQIGAIAALVVAVGGIVLAVRSPGDSAQMADPAVRRKYWTIVAVEFGLIAVGALILGATGSADWISVWVCAVVGVHFVPLAGVFRAEPLKVVGIVLVVVAAVALLLGIATSVPPVTVTGAGAGLVLLVSGALGLVAGRGAPHAGSDSKRLSL